MGFILVTSLLISCKYFRGDNCNNTLPIVGTYKNIYDKDAKNILIIKEDGTFEQVFSKENIIKKNKGTWKFSKESCYVELNNLELMHQLGNMNKKMFSETGKYRLNKIVFIEGLSKEFDFYRMK